MFVEAIRTRNTLSTQCMFVMAAMLFHYCQSQLYTPNTILTKVGVAFSCPIIIAYCS